MDSYLTQRLIEADKEWSSQDIPEDEYDNIPDGKYTAKIMELKIKTTSNEQLLLSWDLKITSKDNGCFGRRVFFNNQLEGEWAWISKKNLIASGMEIEHLTELPTKIATIIENEIEITVKTKEKDGKQYQNYFINKQIVEDGI